MKSKIAANFLRWILFVFMIWKAFYYLVKEAWIGIFPTFQPDQFFPTFALGIAYLIMGLCLLFSPQKTAKGIFIFLTLFCLLPFLIVFAFIYTSSSGFTFLSTPKFISTIPPYVFWAFTAYIYYYLTQRNKTAEQGAAANP